MPTNYSPLLDSSQGSEADIVILSGVRSNPAGNLGFIGASSGIKRTCVALSRAREALIVVGDKSTLASGPAKAFCRLADPAGEFGLKALSSFAQLAKAAGSASAKSESKRDVADLFGGAAAAPSPRTAKRLDDEDGDWGM